VCALKLDQKGKKIVEKESAQQYIQEQERAGAALRACFVSGIERNEKEISQSFQEQVRADAALRTCFKSGIEPNEKQKKKN